MPGCADSPVAGAGTEAPRSYRHSPKLNTCSALVLTKQDNDNGTSFSRDYGGSGMLIAGNSSSTVALAINVAESSLRVHNASSNAEEPYIRG